MNRRNVLKQLGTAVAASSFLAPARTSAFELDTTGDKKTPRAGGAPIHLDHNENAYGASEKAMAALQESGKEVSRYPDASSLQKELAATHSELRSGANRTVKPEQIVLGCGSTDVLRTAAWAFLRPTDTLIVAAPTCNLMAQFARERRATVAEVPLRKDHAHDLSGMLKRASSSGASGLIYVCNPNNPTSTLTPRKDIEEFLAKVPGGFHVVVDEAYHHYAGGSGAYLSFVDHPSENPRVIVTRTFSTAYGLAGARVGYAVTSSAVAEKMAQKSLPFAVSRPAILAASAALADREHVETCTKRNFDDRQEFMNQVNGRMLRALDSHANFMCLNVMRPANEILEHYQKNNFVLAPQIPSMPTYLRVTLGNREEMLEFWRVWDLLKSHPMSM